MIRNAISRHLGRLKSINSLSTMATVKDKFTVSIEGNIGSGKSSLLSFFRNFPYVEAFEEPIELWTRVGGKHNALQILYEDPVRWSFAFNHYTALTRLQILAKPISCPVKMIERSLFTTRYTFVEHSHKIKWLNDLEYSILNEHFDFIESSFRHLKIDLFVYLRASSEICLERVRKRARQEERMMTLEFLQELNELHEDLFIHQSSKLPAPVLVLDASSDLAEMLKMYEEKKAIILGGHV